MSNELTIRWLGRTSFEETWKLQEELVREKGINASLGDELLLLEHEPVYTIGRTPDRSSLRDPAHLPHSLFLINRGGQATYHGPGQLIGYPIINLRRCGQDLHRYLRWLEQVLIETLDQIGIEAETRDRLTGVWIGNRKIASIGVGIRHWITMHGFALNVCGDLTPFDQIVPCGIDDVIMTSIARETGHEWSVLELSRQVALVAERRLGILRQYDLARST